MAIPKLLEAASNGTRQGGPGDDGSDESFVYGGPENADGPAVQTGAWLADVTYERAARPECTNNIKQIAIAIHALDAGECTIDICAQDSPPASPDPVTHTGWGPWEVVLGGPLKNTGYENPSSFQINSAGADDMGRSFDLVFSTQTAFPQRDGNTVATESLEIAHEGFLGESDLRDYSTGNVEDSFVWKTGDGHDSTSHSGGVQVVLHDGSVRLADASDSFVNFDDDSQPIGQTVTFTYTISNQAPMHAPPNDAQSCSGADEAGSRLFVGNLTMHSEVSNEPRDTGGATTSQWYLKNTNAPETSDATHNTIYIGGGSTGVWFLENTSTPGYGTASEPDDLLNYSYSNTEKHAVTDPIAEDFSRNGSLSGVDSNRLDLLSSAASEVGHECIVFYLGGTLGDPDFF
jgi:hypothetical protein